MFLRARANSSTEACVYDDVDPGDQGLPADGRRLYSGPRRRSGSHCLGVRRSTRHRSLQQDARSSRQFFTFFFAC